MRDSGSITFWGNFFGKTIWRLDTGERGLGYWQGGGVKTQNTGFGVLFDKNCRQKPFWTTNTWVHKAQTKHIQKKLSKRSEFQENRFFRKKTGASNEKNVVPPGETGVGCTNMWLALKSVGLKSPRENQKLRPNKPLWITYE